MHHRTFNLAQGGITEMTHSRITTTVIVCSQPGPSPLNIFCRTPEYQKLSWPSFHQAGHSRSGVIHAGIHRLPVLHMAQHPHSCILKTNEPARTLLSPLTGSALPPCLVLSIQAKIPQPPFRTDPGRKSLTSCRCGQGGFSHKTVIAGSGTGTPPPSRTPRPV